MSLIRRLLSPTPARPGRSTAKRSDLENPSPSEHNAILDALEWSDLDSSHDLVSRTDSALETLGSAGSRTSSVQVDGGLDASAVAVAGAAEAPLAFEPVDEQPQAAHSA